MATEERLVLTAELKDNLSGPLAKIDKSVSDTAKRIADMNAKVTASADKSAEGVSRASDRSTRVVKRNAEEATRATQKGLRDIGKSVTGLPKEFDGASRKLRNIAGDVSGNWGRTFSNLPRTAGGAAAGIVRSFGSLGNNLANVAKRAMNGVSTAMTVAAGGIGIAVGGVLAKALYTGLDRAKVIQDSIASGTVLFGGDGDKAQKLVKDVAEVVTGTPYNLPDFAKAATDLLAFGASAEKIPGYLTAIGEAAASRGPDAPEIAKNLAVNMGQMLSLGRMTGDDIQSFAMVGVDALAILGNRMGKTRAEIQKMVSDGAVPAEAAIDHLMSGIMEGTDGVNGKTVKLDGTMAALRETVSGSYGSMNASIAKMGAGFYDPEGTGSSGIMGQLPALFNAMGGLFGALGEKVFKPLGRMLSESEFIPKLTTWVERLTGAISAPAGKGGVMDFIGKFGALSGGAAGGALALGSSVLSSIPIIGRFIPVLNPFLGILLGLIATSPELRSALGGALESLMPLFETLLGTFVNLAPVLVDLVELGLKGLIWAIETITPALPIIVPLLGGIMVATKLWAGAQFLLNGAFSGFGAVLGLSPIGKILTIIGLVAAASIWAYQNIDWFRQVVDNALGWVVVAWGWVKDSIMMVIDTLNLILAPFGGIEGALGGLGQISTTVLGKMGEDLTETGGAIDNLLLPVGGVDGAMRDLGITFIALRAILGPGNNKTQEELEKLLEPLGGIDGLFRNIGILGALWFADISRNIDGLLEFLAKVKLALDGIGGLFGGTGFGMAANAITGGPKKVVRRGIVDGAIGLSKVARFFTGGPMGGLGFAGGGVLPGYSPGIDSIPAMLSPGEGVLVPELVREIGPGNIMAANREASGGRAAGSGPSGGSSLLPGKSGSTVIESGAIQLTFTGPANYAEVKAAVRDALADVEAEKERAY